MSIVENYYLYNFNSIILSKIFINFLGNFPKIKKLSFYFIINNKQYKKNLLLFYIMISLIFGGILVLKRKEIQGLQVFKMKIKEKFLLVFFFTFINLYLPLFSVAENSIKKSLFFLKYKKKKFFLYRLNYFSFPVIPELDLVYLDLCLYYLTLSGFN